MTAVVIPVVQRTPAWEAARLSGIGASQAAAAIGLSRWDSPFSLWAEKLGLVPPVEQNDAMLLGELMEPVVAALYEREAGVRLRRRNQLLRHPQHPWMLASLDRVRPGRRIVELKNTARGDGYGEPGTDEVPDEVLVQVIHQMAVLGAPEADVAVLVGGRAPLRVYTVRRDLEAEAVVIDQEREFWRHVELRTEPAVDGSEATRRALAAMYTRDNGEELTADGDVAATLAALRDVRAAIAAHEANRDRLEALVMDAMGEATALVAPGIGRVTWKATKDIERTDWKALTEIYGRTVDSLVAELRAHVPVLALEGIDVSADEGLERVHESLRSIYTTTKPGSRRFLPRWEEETDV